MCVPDKYNFSSGEFIKLIKEKGGNFWLEAGEAGSVKIFKWAAKNISAYRHFLRRNGINRLKIKNYKNFKNLPVVSKNNYLKKYSIEKTSCRCILNKRTVFTATSGSTGTPFYFPRGNALDWQCSVIKELFLKNGDSSPVLVIVGFGMGVWIGGLITYSAFDIAAKRGYPLSIITPGINKQEIFNALKNLSPHYKQTILIGYPPFVKDIIDEAGAHGINLKDLNMRLMFAAEAFTEKFRDYVAKKAGVKNIYLGTSNIYGSADIGAMAFETPICILIRRLALKNKKIFREIFSAINKTPTLAQYITHFINFEEENGEVLLTGDNVLPLIRYSIGDHGGVLTLSEIKKKFKKYGIDLVKEAKKAGIEKHIYELPFVFVYERADFSTTLYGALIYPEPVREALQSREFANVLTGKFAMMTKYDKKNNQYLEINIELQKDKKETKGIKRKILSKIHKTLREKSSEFREITSHIKDKPLVQIVLWPAEHPSYFKPGVKQKWVLK